MAVKFRPNYAKLYPGVSIPKDMLDFMKKDDMRMENQERRKSPRIRKDKPEKPPLEASLEKYIAMGHPLPGTHAPSAEDDFFQAHDQANLISSLNSLSGDELKVIVLYVFENLTIRECAARLGISKSQADRLKNKSLGKLKRLLEKQM